MAQKNQIVPLGVFLLLLILHPKSWSSYAICCRNNGDVRKNDFKDVASETQEYFKVWDPVFSHL